MRLMGPTAFLCCLLLTPLLQSCGSSAVLYTDDLFLQAAPEVVDAWRTLTASREARVKDLGSSAGLIGLRSDLEAAPKTGGSVLVGLALSADERSTLEAAFPSVRFVFFVPETQAGTAATITVDRLQAWLIVARAAALEGPTTTATALFPDDVSEQDQEAFAQAWAEAGGGGLTRVVWPETGPLTREQNVIFQWVGPQADSALQTLTFRGSVHGHPGIYRLSGTTGITWSLKTAGLGDFLWNAVTDPEKKTHFLPLETVVDRR